MWSNRMATLRFVQDTLLERLPSTAEFVVSQALNTVFTPRLLLRHAALVIVLHSVLNGWEFGVHWLSEMWEEAMDVWYTGRPMLLDATDEQEDDGEATTKGKTAAAGSEGAGAVIDSGGGRPSLRRIDSMGTKLNVRPPAALLEGPGMSDWERRRRQKRWLSERMARARTYAEWKAFDDELKEMKRDRRERRWRRKVAHRIARRKWARQLSSTFARSDPATDTEDDSEWEIDDTAAAERELEDMKRAMAETGGAGIVDRTGLIEQIKDMEGALANRDLKGLMFLLRREGLYRNRHGILNKALFQQQRGARETAIEADKDLAMKYQSTVVEVLTFIATTDYSQYGVSNESKLAFFNELRHTYGRTALTLSGGASLGLFHVGVARALVDAGLFPRIISGASAGSLVAAFMSTRTVEELRVLLHRKDFSDHVPTNFFKFERELDVGGFVASLILDGGKFFKMDTEHFRRVVHAAIGDFTFQEAFDRTGRILNITVSPKNDFDPPRLLNYLTAPHVIIWSAAAASCAIPGVFEAPPLLVKEPDGRVARESEEMRWTDGSIESDLPMQQLSELFNVNHFIISQVNPHAAFLSRKQFDGIYNDEGASSILVFLAGLHRFVKNCVCDWIKNVVEFMVTAHQDSTTPWSVRRGLYQLVIQDYDGRDTDIVIVPFPSHLHILPAFSRLLTNYVGKPLLDIFHTSAQRAYPHIEHVWTHCVVEQCLDKCVTLLRKRILIEESLAQSQALRRQRSAERRARTARIRNRRSSMSAVPANSRRQPNEEQEQEEPSPGKRRRPHEMDEMLFSGAPSTALLQHHGLSIIDRVEPVPALQFNRHSSPAPAAAAGNSLVGLSANTTMAVGGGRRVGSIGNLSATTTTSSSSSGASLSGADDDDYDDDNAYGSGHRPDVAGRRSPSSVGSDSTDDYFLRSEDEGDAPSRRGSGSGSANGSDSSAVAGAGASEGAASGYTASARMLSAVTEYDEEEDFTTPTPTSMQPAASSPRPPEMEATGKSRAPRPHAGPTEAKGGQEPPVAMTRVPTDSVLRSTT